MDDTRNGAEDMLKCEIEKHDIRVKMCGRNQRMRLKET